MMLPLGDPLIPHGTLSHKIRYDPKSAAVLYWIDLNFLNANLISHKLYFIYSVASIKSITKGAPKKAYFTNNFGEKLDSDSFVYGALSLAIVRDNFYGPNDYLR